MRAIGLDQFHTFVHAAAARADTPLPAPLVRIAPEVAPPVRAPSPVRVPMPPGGPAPIRGGGWIGLIVALRLFLDWLAERRQTASRAEIEAAMERFGLGAGSGREAAAKALLEAETKQPGLIRRALNGEAEAVTVVREIMQAKEAPGEGIETYSEDERALVKEMVAAGYDNKAIREALDKRRAADPARTRRDLMDARQANTPWIPREVLERIPVEWGLGKPSKEAKKGKDGWRWEDPKNKGDGVRIDKGDPNLSYEMQREDHVVVRLRGRVLGRDGSQLPGDGSIERNWQRAHIPLRDYSRWSDWNRRD